MKNGVMANLIYIHLVMTSIGSIQDGGVMWDESCNLYHVSNCVQINFINITVYMYIMHYIFDEVSK